MFADRRFLFKALVTSVVALALIAAGCGGGDQSTTTSAQTPAAEPEVADADPDDVEVISGWVDALRAGDTERAAGYFAIPSTAENGPLLTEIESKQDALAFNESLPCGAKLISARSEGDFTTATFRLTERPGGDCGTGTGAKASTSFEIEGAKIVEWRRVGTPSADSSAGNLS
jgi:hypothetical protein